MCKNRFFTRLRRTIEDLLQGFCQIFFAQSFGLFGRIDVHSRKWCGVVLIKSLDKLGRRTLIYGFWRGKGADQLPQILFPSRGDISQLPAALDLLRIDGNTYCFHQQSILQTVRKRGDKPAVFACSHTKRFAHLRRNLLRQRKRVDVHLSP